jgi:tetratricopeptide (TPR) repeat protein
MKIDSRLIDVDIILDRLSGLPLALTQAGSYMQETNMSASAYAEHYDSTWERLMQRQSEFPLEEYGDRNVLTTWTISYEQVRKQSEGAAWLLKLWGFMDHGELWYELVAAGSRLSKYMDTPRWLLEIAEDELAYAEAVGLLSRYSLADAREGSNSHSMHSVLHRWCGRLAEGGERSVLGCIAAGIVAWSVPFERDTEFWKMRKRLLAHAVCVSGRVVDLYFVEGEPGRDMIQAWMYHNLGYLLAGEVRLKEAEFMYERALQGREKTVGAEHLSTLDTVNNLGALYEDQGLLDKSEAMYERALQGREKALGAEHTSTLNIVNNLCVLYRKQGRLDKAEAMCERALQGKEKALGAEHLSTLETVDNLGSIYRRQGQLDKAEAMYERALHGIEKALGAEHMSTLSTVNNLGILYRNQGRLDKAEAMYERALQGVEKALGAEHTSTLSTVNNLGNIYTNQGRLDKAEAMYERALQGVEKVLGVEHTSTLRMINNLGVVYVNQGRLDKAEAMYKRALQGREKALGAKHTSTLQTVDNLGKLYADQGRLDQAEVMYERALRGYEKAIKPENLPTYVPALRNMWNFASLCIRQDRVEEARGWYTKALFGYEKVVGSDHHKCHSLRRSIAALDAEQDEVDPLQAELPVHGSSKAPPANTEAKTAKKAKRASKRHRVFDGFKRKER